MAVCLSVSRVTKYDNIQTDGLMKEKGAARQEWAGSNDRRTNRQIDRRQTGRQRDRRTE